MNERPTLTTRQSQILSLLTQGQSVTVIGSELAISENTVRNHMRAAKGMVGVRTYRALVYKMLAGGWLPKSETSSPVAVCPVDDVTELVWSGLRYDVRDAQLEETIASTTRHVPRRDIDTALAALRMTSGLSDCGLIRLGFTTGLLSGSEGVTPPRTAPPFDALSHGSRP
ncbi:response regulator transcription factor [Streptomyces sp. NPDC002917]|uniref:response regulator transcription factor n=1 Tax=Streptomyces sp. NPDC002917 TaxID=3364671 RepID=UPI00367512B3